MVSLGNMASGFGRRLFAGAIGTAAMTVSSTIEAKVRDRGSSSAPADAAGKVLGVEPRDESGKARFSNVVHWGYGTSWGAVRGLLHAGGIDGVKATGVHFAAIWGGAQVMLPVLEVAPPPWKTEPKRLAIDAFHHAVYVVATAITFSTLDSSAS